MGLPAQKKGHAMIIETERLQLREFSTDDLDSIYELVYADPVVKDAWSGRQGTPDEIKSAFAEAWIATKSEYGLKALELKETESLVGLMSFQPHLPDEDTSWVALESDLGHEVGGDPAFIEAELTYALGRSHWGNGYATEMGVKLVEFGFTALGIHRIINSVRANNERSIGLMRRLGFRIEPNNAPTPPGINGILDANIPSLPLKTYSSHSGCAFRNDATHASYVGMSHPSYGESIRNGISTPLARANILSYAPSTSGRSATGR